MTFHRILLLAVTAAAGCGGDVSSPPPPPPPPAPVARVSLTPGNAELVPAQTAQLTAFGRNLSGGPVVISSTGEVALDSASVTVSAGTSAIIPEGIAMLETLFEVADSALYRSKNLGRNRVTRADFPTMEGVIEGKSAA